MSDTKLKGLKATPEKEYITAFDPKIQRRTTFIIHEGEAISLISGHRFKYEKEVKKE